MYNPFALKDKTILITGASSGIGAEAAIQCSKMGGKLIITGRDKERLEKTFSQLEGQGHEQHIADLTREDEINNLVDTIPVLDGIVLNAGIGLTKIIKFLKKDDIDTIFMTNFKSPVLISQKLLASKKVNKGSSFVFISSIAPRVISPGNSMYAATKGAMNAFAKTLAKEVAPQKIRVNCIQPGTIKTLLLASKANSDDQWAVDEKKYLIGRFGVPEDIAYLIIYLLSDASQWMTGTGIIIDGGHSLYK